MSARPADAADGLLLDAATKLIELRRDPAWRSELPLRCTPVLWFGNSKSPRPRVLTLGANPSRSEFLDDNKADAIARAGSREGHSSLRYLEPPRSRFRPLLAAERPEDLLQSASLRAAVLDGLDAYFEHNPYRWFGKDSDAAYNVEGFLRGFGASFYGLAEFQALHIDLFPFATLRDFNALARLASRDLFETGWAGGMLKKLAAHLRPSAVVIFGKANWIHFCEHVEQLAEAREGTVYGAGRYWLARSSVLQAPVVGISTNLGNPKGFDAKSLREFGEHVRTAMQPARRARVDSPRPTPASRPAESLRAEVPLQPLIQVENRMAVQPWKRPQVGETIHVWRRYGTSVQSHKGDRVYATSERNREDPSAVTPKEPLLVERVEGSYFFCKRANGRTIRVHMNHLWRDAPYNRA